MSYIRYFVDLLGSIGAVEGSRIPEILREFQTNDLLLIPSYP